MKKKPLYLESSLTMEEIESNFKDVDVFAELIEGLQEALEHAKGNAELTMHHRTLPVVDATEIRKSLCLTQKQFAYALGVSCRTVESWDAKRTSPTPTAKKLLWLLQQDPSLIMKLNSISE